MGAAGTAPERRRRESVMAWDFTTEPEFQEKLDWADRFVRENVEPLDLLYPKLIFHPLEEPLRSLVNQLKDAVRAEDL